MFLGFSGFRFHNLLSKIRFPMAPQGKPLCGKGSDMDPLHVRFSSQTVECICFCKSNSAFSWKPCFLRSSVWGQLKQVFVFPPRLRGGVGNIMGIYWQCIETYMIWPTGSDLNARRTTDELWRKPWLTEVILECSLILRALLRQLLKFLCGLDLQQARAAMWVK